MRRAHFLFRAVVSASLVLALVNFGAPATADSIRPNDSARGRDHDAARQGVNRGQVLPLSEVIRRVQARYPGQLLDASYHELVPGQPTYRVLILTSDNRRLAVWVDARSGQILRVEGA